jgi:hypothetical protein
MKENETNSITINFHIMKTFLKESGVLLLFAMLFITLTSCSKNSNTPAVNSNNYNGMGNMDIAFLQGQINAMPYETLSEDEKNSLIYIREEEKLARDVYLTLNTKRNINVFSNISSSEQTHMDAILLLLKKYNIPDPAGENAIGVFTNQTLQGIYTQLVAQGNASLLAAYKTGATIEDLDIFDLKTALAKIDNQDIKLVYDNLAKGSRNHMRAFYRNILNAGGTYTPKYITQTEFDAIINSDMERGRQ